MRTFSTTYLLKRCQSVPIFSFCTHKVRRMQQLPPINDYSSIMLHIVRNGYYHNASQKQVKDERLWLKQCLPTLKQNRINLLRSYQYGNLCSFLLRVKLLNKDFIDLFQKQLTNLEISKMSLGVLLRIYAPLVNLKYSNKDLLGHVRKSIAFLLAKSPYLPPRSFIQYIRCLQSILLQKDLSRKQKQELFEQFTLPLTRNKKILQAMTQKKQQIIMTLSNLHQMVQLNKIQVNQVFSDFFQDANHNIDKFIKNNSLGRWKLTRYRMADLNNQLEKKKYYQSIFEDYIEEKLKIIGYNFIFGQVIKGNEYDVVVTGHNKLKFNPLSHIDINASHQEGTKQFPRQRLSLFNHSQSYDYEIKKVKYQHKVILNLNGPLHYIESDVLPKLSVTAKQQFKYQKIKLYGYTHYNVIDYLEWQKVNAYQKQMKELLDRKIQHPIVLDPHL